LMPDIPAQLIVFYFPGIDHITWGLIDFSFSFIVFLWAK
jgi:hypothetical protein